MSLMTSTTRTTRTTRTGLTRAYALGLGYGGIWLILAGLGFSVLDVFGVSTTPQEIILFLLALFVIAGALLLLDIRLLRLGLTLPRTNSGRISRTGLRVFYGLILLELIGWGVLDTLLVRNNLAVWIVPVNLLIIGAHFIPLTFVFKVPAYLVMGILWIVAILGSILLIPASTMIGHESAWFTIPSLLCIAITWLTILYLLVAGLREMRLAAQPSVASQSGFTTQR